jgi:hypothetical protein
MKLINKQGVEVLNGSIVHMVFERKHPACIVLGVGHMDGGADYVHLQTMDERALRFIASPKEIGCAVEVAL